MKKDRYNEDTDAQPIDPAVVAADVNGDSVDLQGYESVTFIASVGETTTTLNSTNNIELEVEESDDDSTFTDVDDDDLIGEVAGTNDGCFGVIDAAADDDASFRVQYVGDKRYVRPVINVIGTVATGPPIGVVAIKHGYKYPPAS